MVRTRQSNSKPVETLPRTVSNWEKPVRTPHPAPGSTASEPGDPGVDPAPGQPRYQDPPWGQVWRTTARVLARRWRLRVVVGAVVLLAIASLALGYRVLFPPSAEPAAPARPQVPRSDPGPVVAPPDPISAADVARAQVAQWIVDNVGTSGVLACDTATCAELEALNYPATALVPLTRDNGEIRSADLVVVTAAVEALLGPRLAQLTAERPVAVAGSGEATIELRVVAPDGPVEYRRRANADLRDRRSAGTQVAQVTGLQLDPVAAEQLRSGQVDARILTVLPALLADHTLTVQGFSASPAEPAGAPLRVLDIARVDGADVSAEHSGTAAVIRFLNAQWPPFLPASTHLMDGSDGQLLRISYPAPSPLGLLGTG